MNELKHAYVGFGPNRKVHLIDKTEFALCCLSFVTRREQITDAPVTCKSCMKIRDATMRQEARRGAENEDGGN